MEKEHTMTEQESLAVIKEMINRSRTNFKDQSFFYLMWGWLVVASLIVEAYLFNIGSPLHPIVWPIMGIGGGIASGIYGKKQGEKAGYSTPIDRIMMFVWVGFVIYLFLVLLNAPKFGTFISGGILKFKPLIYGGIASFVLVVAAALVPNLITSFNHAMIFLAISIVCSYLIPGYMLKNA
jgi:hypothetical protein